MPRLAGVGLAAAIVLLAGAVTLLGLGSQPAAVSPTDPPTEAALAAAPTREPTPSRTGASRTDAAPPADAAPANQPTATRSNSGAEPTHAKPPKAEHKPKKDVAGKGQAKDAGHKNKKPKKSH